MQIAKKYDEESPQIGSDENIKRWNDLPSASNCGIFNLFLHNQTLFTFCEFQSRVFLFFFSDLIYISWEFFLFFQPEVCGKLFDLLTNGFNVFSSWRATKAKSLKMNFKSWILKSWWSRDQGMFLNEDNLHLSSGPQLIPVCVLDWNIEKQEWKQCFTIKTINQSMFWQLSIFLYIDKR